MPENNWNDILRVNVVIAVPSSNLTINLRPSEFDQINTPSMQNDMMSIDPPGFQVIRTVYDDLADVQAFLTPFMDGQLLLQRTSLELQLLLKHAFKAIQGERVIGFCALEIYSKKLAEIQCLAVDLDFRRKGVGRELVRHCVDRAREERVLELMAITSSDDMFMSCGFDYSLPHQKRALFIQP